VHARALLLSFGVVRSPSGVGGGRLRPKDVGKSGWCFFAAFHHQLGSNAVPGFRALAVLALEAMADRQAEFSSSVQGVDFDGREVPEVRAARAALRDVSVCRALGVVELLTPFQCAVLDKFEGVLEGDLLESRRYADDCDMQVLLRPVGLEVLVLESNDVLGSDATARSRLYPSLERASTSRARSKLETGEVDMVFVRYELGSYLHYTSVVFDSGAPWRVGAAKRSAVEALYAASAVCRAVRVEDLDLARAMMLSRLLEAGALEGAPFLA